MGHPLVLSWWVECLPAPRQMLAPPATVNAHTATTMTVTMSQSTASTTVVEVASDGHMLVGELRSTVVPPTAYARSAYSPYIGHAPLAGPALGHPVHRAEE